jgi:prophage DNA circulation protein
LSGFLGGFSGLLGAANSLASTGGSLLNDVARLGQSLGGSRAIDNSTASWAGGSWAQQLQPGSWRGVPFVLDSGDTAAGRRVAIHEYPYRDDTWAEDLGRLPRRMSIQAWVVGDDCYQQRDAMIRACEQSGSGTLVHPTLGSIECVLMEFQTTDRRERGRVVEFQFAFIVAGDVKFPATAIATAQNVASAIGKLTGASASDLGTTLASIGSVAKIATNTVTKYTGFASAIVGDASRIFNSVRGLTGFFGRYSVGSRSTLQKATTTVQSALRAATTARTLVTTGASLVNRLASFL